jgi:hypothetical protein
MPSTISKNTAKNRDEIASFIENSGATVDIEDVKREYPNMSIPLWKFAKAFILENGHCVACCICGRMQDARMSSEKKDLMIKRGF